MPLSKNKPNTQMYRWITHQITHLGGLCPHHCKYCYAKMRNYCNGRYSGQLRLVEKELSVSLGSDKKIFVGHMTDMWAFGIKSDWIRRILAHCNCWPNNQYIFQTKNPLRYIPARTDLPANTILGCTIETNFERFASHVSDAPCPTSRAMDMHKVSEWCHPTFITIEPVLKFHIDLFTKLIVHTRPNFVNIGADSKNNGLPEPSPESIRALINNIRTSGIQVNEKPNLARLLK